MMMMMVMMVMTMVMVMVMMMMMMTVMLIRQWMEWETLFQYHQLHGWDPGSYTVDPKNGV